MWGLASGCFGNKVDGKGGRTLRHPSEYYTDRRRPLTVPLSSQLDMHIYLPPERGLIR